ncbi:hypothetical protein MLD38_039028 [Melastoma candidum]|uniref:Uncharacterized protein n=1 Tax=Melastoma candidum TaxID=119954 RepID=A0ACB9L338_9MYRT|nr:hypothetical protein MLD38_039028 [Melastoma candidum]
MDTPNQLAIESFSCSWLSSSRPSLDSLDLDLDRHPGTLSPPQDFYFDVPASDDHEFAHADELFSLGVIKSVLFDAPISQTPPANSGTVSRDIPPRWSLLRRWRKSFLQTIWRCFRCVGPFLVRLANSRWCTRVDDIDRRKSRDMGWHSPRESSLFPTYSSANCLAVDDSRAESPIYEAVLHCKRSIEKYSVPVDETTTADDRTRLAGGGGQRGGVNYRSNVCILPLRRPPSLPTSSLESATYPMISPLANWRESLEKISLAVHDDEDDEIYGPSDADDPDRRNSHSFSHSTSGSRSPLSNGIDSLYHVETEQCKAEIKRLQESEAEIKALAINYAALLKEREDQISRLNKENGFLKQSLDSTTSSLNNLRMSTNASTMPKETGDLSPNRQLKGGQFKIRSGGSPGPNGIASKQDIMSNGTRHTGKYDSLHGKEKDLADLLEEKNRSLSALKSNYDSEVKELKEEVEKERSDLAKIRVELREERQMNQNFLKEIQSLKDERNNTVITLNQLRHELNAKIAEVERLQVKMSNGKGMDGSVEGLKRTITSLEKENTNLKTEKNDLEIALRASMNPSSLGASSISNEEASSSERYAKEELERSVAKFEMDLKEARQERDKALRQLSRLKQHLLDKESEESEKMDEDRKIIEELREKTAYQNSQILQLENALEQAKASQDQLKILSNSDALKHKEIVDELNRKLANTASLVEAKNMEILNLQTALGQYYAEIEAKGRLERDLTLAREESMKFSELLKGAENMAIASQREKEEILGKLSDAEKALIEGNNRVNKLEDDNAKLRRVVEQSMTRLNRMSVDSDYLVDRRIVIKLLVTYFQRNHSKEVLDLMVRMLGFSEEDKQRIGVAQHGAGKGVVRGVLGIPGRLVGGILGGSSAEAPINMVSDNQSIADLWVDFLLSESEEREKRDRLAARPESSAAETSGRSAGAAATAGSPFPDNRTVAAPPQPGFSRFSSSLNQSPAAYPSNSRHLEQYGSEFSTVPLSSTESTSWTSRPLPRY